MEVEGLKVNIRKWEQCLAVAQLLRLKRQANGPVVSGRNEELAMTW